jgi:hypothetical protein
MLCLLPRRAPYSDWFAQVCRIIERRTGEPCHIVTSAFMESLYTCGISAQEVADDLLEGLD